MSQENASLFPAYAASSTSANNDGASNREWLTNNSFSNEAYEAVKLNEISLKIFDEDEEACRAQDRKKQKTSSQHCSSTFPKPTVSDSRRQPSKQPFFIDTKYDPENFSLGSLDFKTIPKHKTVDCPPLGISLRDLGEWSSLSKKKKKSKIPRRYFSKNTRRYVNSIARRVDLLQTEDVLRGNYFPLNKVWSETAVEMPPLADFDGVSKTWKTYFSASSDGGKPKEEFDVAEVEILEKIGNFNRDVMKSPRDEKLWLDFVDFQREVFRSPSFAKMGLSTEANLYDKQLSILDKAVKHNPNSIRLGVARLDILKNVREKDELMLKWESFLFYHPNDAVAWKHYLKFVLSDISYFDVPRLTKLLHKCMRTFSNILEGRMKSHPAPPRFLHDAIEMFGSICSIFHSIGYRELALGLFQSQIEFNLFVPANVVDIDSCSDRISVFEPFWDSGVPRIGEEKAIGWSKTISEKIITSNAEASVLGLNDSEDAILAQNLSECETWLQFEKLREASNWLPWRPNLELDHENEELDDPDRRVSFEQVSRYLFQVDSERDKFFLLCQFFEFLGVPLHRMECSLFSQGEEHTLLVTEDFSRVYPLLKDVFPDKKVPESLNFQGASYIDLHSTFVDNVFNQSLEVFSDCYRRPISIVWLRYKIDCRIANVDGPLDKKFVNSLRRNAKSLLKRPENRNSLTLWSEYLRLEWLTDNKEKVNQMLETLLLSSTDEEPVDCASLWYILRSHIELCLEMGTSNEYDGTDNSRLLWILSHVGRKAKYVSYSGESELNNIVIMKAAMGLKTMVSQQIENLKCEEGFSCCCLNLDVSFLDCVCCTGYFQYLFYGPREALGFYENLLADLRDKLKGKSSVVRYFEEQIVVLQAKLQNHHAKNSNSSLLPVQTFLCDSLEEYPGNACLLYLLVKIKTAAPVIGPIRRFFYKLLKEKDELPTLTWLFAMISELLICFSISNSLSVDGTDANQSEGSLIKGCGIVWKVRSLFEAALSLPSLRHCVALWRSHLKFEMTIGELTKAKAVFYQALQNCPWVKALYLDGITYFPEDLCNLLDMMNEKQLRLRTPLEEVALLKEHASKETTIDGLIVQPNSQSSS